jgi:hypothetical protein
MKIFISSLIGGFEEFRSAARSAILTLGHDPIGAEDFAAQPNSPQVACLQAVRSADLVILILGSRYGFVQGSSGVSPTHEEYLEARGSKPILTFLQGGVEHDEQQAQFVSEVSAWQGGHFRAGFATAADLRDLVTRALHQYELANAVGRLDTPALLDSACGLLPKARHNSQSSRPSLHIAIIGGPAQRLLRPVQLESQDLADAIHQQALFNEPRLFSKTKGVDGSIEGAYLVVEQERGARIQVGEDGSLVLRLPLDRGDKVGNGHGFGGFTIIQEDVMNALVSALSFGSWLLDKIDPTLRVNHVAIAASIEASDYMGWRTQAEQDASPNRATMRMGSSDKPPTSSTDRPRAALLFQTSELAEDLMVPIRRQMKA